LGQHSQSLAYPYYLIAKQEEEPSDLTIQCDEDEFGQMVMGDRAEFTSKMEDIVAVATRDQDTEEKMIQAVRQAFINKKS
jgi:hypothetical protein